MKTAQNGAAQCLKGVQFLHGACSNFAPYPFPAFSSVQLTAVHAASALSGVAPWQLSPSKARGGFL